MKIELDTSDEWVEAVVIADLKRILSYTKKGTWRPVNEEDNEDRKRIRGAVKVLIKYYGEY